MLACAILPVAGFAPFIAQWKALGMSMGEAMRESVARGEDIAALTARLMEPAGPLRIAIRAVIDALRNALWPRLLLFALIGALYWPLQESGAARATFGKRAMGLVATDARGHRLSMAQALFRHFVGALSWLTLNIGHLLAARAPGHRALHDRLADTRVSWRTGVTRKVPMWGWALLAAGTLLPVLFAVWAAMSLSDAMQAALGL